MNESEAPSLLLLDNGRWLRFEEPSHLLVATELPRVREVLAEAQLATKSGMWAAGFLSYEAAPAFDPALAAHLPGALPLAWWALFEAPQVHSALPSKDGERSWHLPWRPRMGRREHARAVAAIHRHIAAGDTYQVNLTFPLTAPWRGNPRAFFRHLHAAQQSGCSAYVDTGRFALCSASPELFFALENGRLTTRPMKGTARRGRTLEEDRAAAVALASSEKDRAENLMIVDMMRNDLGRIARPGTVRVEELFNVETYPTVHQMTSTVTAQTDADPLQVIEALFPCASITGAPKVRTSEIIQQLERAPRGAYTGAIGYLAPGGRARLNVAIRTVTIDREAQTAIYGTGGGIVWDSEADKEYEECLLKARILTAPRPRLELFETLLWRPRSGYFLLDRHLERLARSAIYFQFPVSPEQAREALLEAARSWVERRRVKLTAAPDGRLEVESEPFPCSGPPRWKLSLDDRPIDTRNPYLFHKTTYRQAYDQALARHPEADEVLLWNERGELTESTRANLALKLEGRWLTPPVESGLLAGTYRAELLARGRLHEEILPVSALEKAEGLRLINSLRGIFKPTLLSSRPERIEALGQG